MVLPHVTPLRAPLAVSVGVRVAKTGTNGSSFRRTFGGKARYIVLALRKAHEEVAKKAKENEEATKEVNGEVCVCISYIYPATLGPKGLAAAILLLQYILSRTGKSVVVGCPYLLHPNTAEEK